jgi:hypothetical protein
VIGRAARPAGGAAKRARERKYRRRDSNPPKPTELQGDYATIVQVDVLGEAEPAQGNTADPGRLDASLDASDWLSALDEMERSA